MVGQADNQKVAPLRAAAQTVDKAPEAVVEIGHGVGFLVVRDPAVRHFPRLVAGQGEESRVPRLTVAPAGDHLVEAVERDAVRHPPVVRPADVGGEVRIAIDALVTRGEEIAVHVGEVDVAAIEEIRLVAGC